MTGASRDGEHRPSHKQRGKGAAQGVNGSQMKGIHRLRITETISGSSPPYRKPRGMQRAHFPPCYYCSAQLISLSMLVLGLSNMRDAAAALVEDGRIAAAAEEERFVRVKHASGLPLNAIRYCLRERGLRLRDVDAVAVPWKYWQAGPASPPRALSDGTVSATLMGQRQAVG